MTVSVPGQPSHDPGKPGKPKVDSSASSRARIGAHALHARYDSRELTKAGRAAFLSRFEREVDPDGILPVGERLRRADHAKSAHFRRLALKSAKARRRGNKKRGPQPE